MVIAFANVETVESSCKAEKVPWKETTGTHETANADLLHPCWSTSAIASNQDLDFLLPLHQAWTKFKTNLTRRSRKKSSLCSTRKSRTSEMKTRSCRCGQTVCCRTDPVRSQVIQTKQNKLSRSSVKTEDEEHGYPDDRTQHLLEEIKHWKSELERRPDPEEVSVVTMRRLPSQCVLGFGIRGEAQEEKATWAGIGRVPPFPTFFRLNYCISLSNKIYDLR